MQFRNDLPLVFAKNSSGKFFVLPAGTMFDAIGTDSNQLYVKLSKDQSEENAQEIQKFAKFLSESCQKQSLRPLGIQPLINIVNEDTITIPLLHANLI